MKEKQQKLAKISQILPRTHLHVFRCCSVCQSSDLHDIASRARALDREARLSARFLQRSLRRRHVDFGGGRAVAQPLAERLAALEEVVLPVAVDVALRRALIAALFRPKVKDKDTSHGAGQGDADGEDRDGRTRARCWRTYGAAAPARFPLLLLRTGPVSPGALIRSKREAMTV